MRMFASVSGMVAAIALLTLAGCGGGNEVSPPPATVENVVPDPDSAEYAKAMAESMK